MVSRAISLHGYSNGLASDDFTWSTINLANSSEFPDSLPIVFPNFSNSLTEDSVAGPTQYNFELFQSFKIDLSSFVAKSIASTERRDVNISPESELNFIVIKLYVASLSFDSS